MYYNSTTKKYNKPNKTSHDKLVLSNIAKGPLLMYTEQRIIMCIFLR